MGEPSKVVTGSHDRTLKVWDLRNKACKSTFYMYFKNKYRKDSFHQKNTQASKQNLQGQVVMTLS